MHRLGKKPEANGKQFFDSSDLFAIEQEYDDMVIGFYDDMPVCDKNLFITHNGSYGHAFWQGDVVQAPADNLGGAGSPWAVTSIASAAPRRSE